MHLVSRRQPKRPELYTCSFNAESARRILSKLLPLTQHSIYARGNPSDQRIVTGSGSRNLLPFGSVPGSLRLLYHGQLLPDAL